MSNLNDTNKGEKTDADGESDAERRKDKLSGGCWRTCERRDGLMSSVTHVYRQLFVLLFDSHYNLIRQLR